MAPPEKEKGARSESREKPKNNSQLIYSKREESTMQDIFFVMLKNPEVIKEFDKFLEQQEEIDELCASMINIALATGTAFQLVKLFIEHEFKSNVQAGEGALFRGNTIASKLIKAYLNAVGRGYLKQVLGPIVHKIVIQERKISLEIDPTKCSSDEEVAKNRLLLIERVKILVDTFTNQKNIDAIPPEIRIIAGYFAEYAKEYSPKQVWALVGGFLLLRYFNPALANPDQFDLVPPGKVQEGNAKRNMILITKVIQNLSNGVEFGKKELFMMYCNDFIKENKARMEKYLENVISFTKPSTQNVKEENVIQVEDMHVLHRIFTQQQAKIAALFGNPEAATQFNKLLEKLGSYSSKISFSFLTGGESKFLTSMLDQHQEEPSFIGWVDKKKYGKVQKRLLVIGNYRIFSLKPGGKIAREGHLLDLTEIKCTVNELQLKFKNFSIVCDTEECDVIINCIRKAFDATFRGMPKKWHVKLSVEQSRLKPLPTETEAEICGNFVRTYLSLCNFYGVPVNQELCWHFTHLPPRMTTFDLKLFTRAYSETPLISNELGPILWSLRFNHYFTSFSIEDYKLDKEAFLDLAEMMKFNDTLSELCVREVGGTREGFLALFDCFTLNKSCTITSLDISNNALDDKGVVALGNWISQAPQSIQKLVIDNVAVTKAGTTFLLRTLKDRMKAKGASIKTLSLNDNPLSTIGCDALGQFLTEGGGAALTHIHLANISIKNLPAVLSGLARCTNLQFLDMSRNKFKPTDCYEWAKYLAVATNLKELNLASTKFPMESVSDLLTSVGSPELKLIFSDNNLGLQGATLIASLQFKMSGITYLDLADNDFGDDGVAALAEAFCSSTYLKTLILDRNFKASKQRPQLIENLTHLITINKTLEHLSIAGSTKDKAFALKTDLVPALMVLSQSSLVSLNISGHQMGNKGAITLAKALRQNNSLTSITWDENQTGYVGFKNIKLALENNQTLRNMPLPLIDVSQALKNESDQAAAIQDLLCDIEALILANQQRS